MVEKTKEINKAEGKAILDNINLWINVNKNDKIRDYVKKWVTGSPI